MLSLNTAFKKVYEKELESYGFKKVKGKQPYFAKVVGDEIVHVITVIPEPTIMPGEKRYGIYGGVATVYRPLINFNITPRDNRNWLINNLYVCRDTDVLKEKSLQSIKECDFYYMTDNEESLLKSMENSVGITKKYLMKELSKVDSLSSCIEYYELFHSSNVLYFNPKKPFFDDDEYYEGLINFKVFGIENFVNHTKEHLEEMCERMIHMIEKGMVGGTLDGFKEEQKESEEDAEKRIAIFKRYVSDRNLYMTIQDELELRKEKNTEILKKYNVI